MQHVLSKYSPSDRIEAESWLLVACVASVLLLSSQSAASFLTYALALLVLGALRRWVDIAHTPYFWLVVATLVYFFLSVFWSEPFEWRAVLTHGVRSLLIFCFVVAIAEVQLRGVIQLWLRRGIVLVGFGAMVAAIAVYFISMPEDGRLNGLGQLDTHVVAALVFAYVLIFGLQVMLRDRGVWRWLGAAAVLCAAISVYLSDSRNAWVSAVLGAAILLLSECTRDRQRFIASIAGVGLILGVVLLALLIDESTRELLLVRGTSFRPEIWSAAIDRLAAGNYWIGLGIATQDNFVVGGIEFLHPHSVYVSSLYQGGIIGLAIFLVLIWRTMSVLFEYYEEADAKLAFGVLGLALPAFLLDGHELLDKIGAMWLLFWMPVAVALGLAWTRQLRDR